MAELEALSKLKMAGRLRFWRGTVEIDERELHEICDEIQAEHDEAVAAMNKAAGNWARADAVERLRENTREHSTESESMSESRWFQLFGSPERAARTLAEDYTDCDYDALLEWLRGDA